MYVLLETRALCMLGKNSHGAPLTALKTNFILLKCSNGIIMTNSGHCGNAH